MARISELHYSNAFANTSGVSEFLEVALAASDDPADFTVSFYQSNGTLGIELTLDDPRVTSSVDPDNGEVIFVLSADNLPILLTDPDGGGPNNYEAFALTDTSAVPGTVIDFYDIGGGTQNITALSGAAAGASSVNVPVPTGPQTTTTSIQWNQPNPDTIVYEALSPGDTGLACFVAGTQVQTVDGPRRIETLSVGDLVWTLDDGFQPLRWVGSQRVVGKGPLRPIRFERGELGAQEPLFLSPQHRLLLKGWRAELLFGEAEVLVPAKALVNDHSVRPVEMPCVRYVHLLFDRHQIVETHGVLSESFLPGDYIMAADDAAVHAEVLALFPQLKGQSMIEQCAARYLCTVREGAAFAGFA